VYLVNFLSLQAADQRYVAALRFRTGQNLLGDKDGSNVVFTVPTGDNFTHNLPFFSIQVYFNGVRQKLLDDYIVSESGGLGTGFDTVTLCVAPRANDTLLVDYIATGAP
jgi:hypothetical protein